MASIIGEIVKKVVDTVDTNLDSDVVEKKNLEKEIKKRDTKWIEEKDRDIDQGRQG